MAGVLAPGFTPEETQTRPFAVSVGYDRWASGLIKLVYASEEQALGMDTEEIFRFNHSTRIPLRDRIAGVYAMEVGFIACESGFASRQEAVIDLPLGLDLTAASLGEKAAAYNHDMETLAKNEEMATKEISKHAGYTEGQSPKLDALKLAYKLAWLTPMVAQCSFLWGRHDEIIGLDGSIPPIVKSNGLTTINPEAVKARAREVIEALNSEIDATIAPQPTLYDRLVAKLLPAKYKELAVREGILADKLTSIVGEAIRKATT